MVKQARQLIESLKNPKLYPHPVKKFTVLETHISFLLLTGKVAYKIKKPLDLGFLDFTTLKKRKFFCEEEVRLNRRLAPQIYVGVVPITGSVRKPCLAGNGRPIEYAVKMREFPQVNRLDQVLRRGRLGPAHMDELAAVLADFHARIAVAGSKSHFGTPEAVFGPALDSFRHLGALEQGPNEERLLAELHAWCEREFERKRDFFLKRKEGGFIRECHGDAHLANMCLYKGRVVLFDCIEFNECFRWIDVMNEVAFTVMDLDDRGVQPWAARFLNRYLEHTGDYAGLSVLPFYRFYRAIVRAKIHAIRFSQGGMAKAQERKVLALYHDYLSLAKRYTLPTRPKLIITHGVSGVGKTYYTERLVERLGAIRVRTDVERKRLFGLKPLEASDEQMRKKMYTPYVSKRVYERLKQVVATGLAAGYTMIADGTFLKRRHRQPFAELAAQMNVPFYILEFKVKESLLKERIQRRAEKRADASEATLAVLEHQQRDREPLEEGEGTVMSLDTTGPTDPEDLCKVLEKPVK